MAPAQDHRFEWPGRPKRHQRGEVLIVADDSILALQLDVEVIAEQRSAFPVRVALHVKQLFRRLAGYVALRPDLPVRVRIAAAHDLTLVLEDLHMVDVFHRTEVRILFRPYIDDPANVLDLHLGQAQVVSRRKADDPAYSRLAFGQEQLVVTRLSRRHIG